MIRQYNNRRKFWINLSFILLMICHSSSHAGLIAYDLYNNKSLNLIDYQNPFEGAFSHSINDTFQKHQQGVTDVSDGLIEDSISRADTLGIIKESQNFDEFFAVQDLDNSVNPTGRATASWIFDIQNTSDLSLSLDLAAMGDFELSDWFRWDYAIDNFDKKTLFELNSEQSKTQAYQMASGAIISLDDPLSLQNQLLDNHFQNFVAPIMRNGAELKLFFTAQQNGGNEVLAFRNLKIEGERNLQTRAAIASPSTAPLILLGLFALLTHHKRKLKRES